MLFRSSDPYGSRSPCGNQREHKHVLGTPKFIHVRRSTYCIVAQVNWGQHCNLWGNNCVSVTPSIPMRLISPYLLIFARLCTADWILYEADIRSLWVCCWQKDTRPFFIQFHFSSITKMRACSQSKRIASIPLPSFSSKKNGLKFLSF